MKEKTDILIIGAGILGCFAARNLCRYNVRVCVVERNADVCTGISKANTGIIYQGYDQHPGTLKADLCRRGSQDFQRLCRELDVRCRKSGLMMISFGERGDAALEQKLVQGKINGVEGIRILTSPEIYDKEPFLCEGITKALYAENTYVVNPWELGIAAFENARDNGAVFYFQEEVKNIRREDGRFFVETSCRTFETRKILCCAGMEGDRIWETVNKPYIKIFPLAADYLVFDKKVGNLISHVISVEPERKRDGLTLVPTADGNILAGPTRREAVDKPQGATASEGIDELKQKCKRLIPELPMDSIIRNFGAVRPNPRVIGDDGNMPSKSIRDFVILEEDGFFAMMGIKTPGITCANELGYYISERIISSFDVTPENNREYDPVRKGICKVSSLLNENPEQLSVFPPEYHEIICRCENVSKGEVLEAIRRGAVTVDGVKRRTGCGMGRCQGGYCMEKILLILANELKTDVYHVTKDGAGTEIIVQ